MKILKILLLCLTLIATARFTHHQTHGFRLSKIRHNLCKEKQWISSSKQEKNLFDQPYHYLGRGLQSFVFASDDGKYVIKIFNNRYQNLIKTYQLLSHIPFLNSWASTKASYYHSKLLRTFTSYQIAENALHEEAGLIYSHLNASSDLPNQLVIIDPLHIAHILDPNELGFIVQKRATMFYPALQHYIQTGQIEQARDAIGSLLQLFQAKYEKGIADNDPLIRTNYGLIDGKAVQIDVGPFSYVQEMADSNHYLPEILKSSTSLKHWLENNAPELADELEKTQAIYREQLKIQ